MKDWCETCKGTGAVEWVSLAKVAAPDGDAYLDSIACKDCRGTGGWKQGKRGLTVSDLREMRKNLR